MWRPVGTLRVPGVERPEPEAAEGRSKDRIYKSDRAILRPPVFQFFDRSGLGKRGAEPITHGYLPRKGGDRQGPASDEPCEELTGGTENETIETLPARPRNTADTLAR